MPRELGKAKRADITGRFPGEEAEHASSVARFLEGAGQLQPLEDGSYMDSTQSGGNGRSTEVPGMPSRRSDDTEVAPNPGGNGQTNELDSNDGSDTLFDNPFGEDALSPHMEMTLEPISVEPEDSSRQPEPASSEQLEPDSGELQPASLEPMDIKPSSDTLHPGDENELEVLDSVPDLMSPEHDVEDDEANVDTDRLSPRSASLPTVKPHAEELDVQPVEAELLAPATSSDTGMLIAEAFSTSPTGDWDEVDFDESDDEKITDKINRADGRAQHTAADAASTGVSDAQDDWKDINPKGDKADDEITDKIFRRGEQDLDDDLTAIQPRGQEVDGEKITNKVEPRSDVDPRRAHPDGVVRDTVNFYNQTQSLHENKQRSQGFPTISPASVNGPQPLDLDAEPPAPMELSADFGSDDDRDDDTDILENDTLRPQRIEDVLGSEPMQLDAQPEMPELSAEEDIAAADQRDTDRFREVDRQPPDLPRPEGTDRLERQDLQPAAPGEPQELPAISDEKVAGGRDTQRFYVADIVPKAEHSGDTTSELQPAEEGVPPLAAAQSSDTAAGLVEESEPSGQTRRETKPPLPEPLPEPETVNADFVAHREPEASTRLIPEYRLQPEPSDETVDEEASSDSRRTDKVALPPEEEKITEKVAAELREPVASVMESSARVKRITDSLSRRMKEERVETLRLIEQAESVAVRLREASEASRTDLIALSARRAAIGGNSIGSGETWTPSIGDLADAELPANNLSSQWQSEPESYPDPDVPDHDEPEITEKATEQPAAYPTRERVPTRAIGEIVSEVERKERDAPTALSELLEQVSQRFAASDGGNGSHRKSFEDELDEDLNVLVAASSRLREAVEEEQEEDRISGRLPAIDEPGPEPPRASSRYEPEIPQPHQQVSARESGLSRDLDQLWEVLDSRRTSTVLLPATPKPARIAPRDEEVLEGWTQETLWKTLSGIAVVTFLLGALFVWVLLKLA